MLLPERLPELELLELELLELPELLELEPDRLSLLLAIR